MASSDQIANNLKRIWEQKKREVKFTQVGAAKELGWTQSAISHYLNNHTEIGTQAIVKLANFLGVSATDIDPDILTNLPDVKTLELRYHLTDASKRLKNKQLHFKVSKQSFVIYCDKEQEIYQMHGATIAAGSYCEVEEISASAMVGAVDCVVVRIKGKKGFQFCMSDNFPPGKVLKMYRCIALRMPVLNEFSFDDLAARYKAGDRDAYAKYAKVSPAK